MAFDNFFNKIMTIIIIIIIVILVTIQKHDSTNDIINDNFS